jgi:tripartite-type tricarboxylate transporter receptor subunit TctC
MPLKSLLMRALGILLAFAPVLLLSAAVAGADFYPSKPVRLIVSFPPGGSPDVVARILAPQLIKQLGKPVVVENHGGAAGVLGTELVAKSAPDGHTLLIVSPFYAVNPAFYKLPFDSLKDFVPVARLGGGPNVLVVNPSVPAKSVGSGTSLRF